MLHAASVLDYAAEATPATTAEYQKSDALALEKIRQMKKVDDAREARKILAEHKDDPKAGEFIRRYISLLDARIGALR